LPFWCQISVKITTGFQCLKVSGDHVRHFFCRLGHATGRRSAQTWTVEYFDADGSPVDAYLITAKVDSPKIVLGDAQVLPI
jgi:hypothetical protein